MQQVLQKLEFIIRWPKLTVNDVLQILSTHKLSYTVELKNCCRYKCCRSRLTKRLIFLNLSTVILTDNLQLVILLLHESSSCRKRAITRKIINFAKTRDNKSPIIAKSNRYELGLLILDI